MHKTHQGCTGTQLTHTLFQIEVLGTLLPTEGTRGTSYSRLALQKVESPSYNWLPTKEQNRPFDIPVFRYVVNYLSMTIHYIFDSHESLATLVQINLLSHSLNDCK